ncbi:multicopy suppressor of a budding defect [Cryomyces antarcticus]|nr:multicopy suppressor of a budding defect [Cryomyces antarcticus]
MMWANEFDKDAIRAKYLGDNFAGTRTSRECLTEPVTSTYSAASGDPVLHDLPSSAIPRKMSDRELPALPQHEEESPIVEQDSVVQQEPLALPLRPLKGPIVEVLPIEGDVEELDTAHIPSPAIGLTEEIQSVNGGSGKEAPSPPPKPSTIGRKPVPRTGRINEHPAFRQKPLEEPITALPEMSSAEKTIRKAWEPHTSSPESLEKESPLVKVKGPGGGGFRRLFGQRKADLPARSATPQPTGPEFSLQVQPQSSISRRISMLRKRSSPAVTPLAEIPYVSAMPPSPVPTEPDAPIPDAHYADSAPSLSHVDSTEQHHADDAYSKFAQGPLAASAVPLLRESTENRQADMTFPQFKTRAAQLLHSQRDSSEAPAGEYAPPTEHDNDAESETSVELKDQMSFPADRWAQIRKNAAERAARMSEEQSQQSRPSQSGRTDDGETSGEETIEARVARIKARVAELTKNMGVPDNVTTYTRQ